MRAWTVRQKKESARPARGLGGRKSGVRLGLLLPGSSGGLRGLGLGHALLKFVDAAGGIDELLLTGVKRVADVANTNENHGLGGAGFDGIAAGAPDFRVLILRMNVSFHNKGRRTYQSTAG